MNMIDNSEHINHQESSVSKIVIGSALTIRVLTKYLYGECWLIFHNINHHNPQIRIYKHDSTLLSNHNSPLFAMFLFTIINPSSAFLRKINHDLSLSISNQ